MSSIEDFKSQLREQEIEQRKKDFAAQARFLIEKKRQEIVKREYGASERKLERFEKQRFQDEIKSKKKTKIKKDLTVKEKILEENQPKKAVFTKSVFELIDPKLSTKQKYEKEANLNPTEDKLHKILEYYKTHPVEFCADMFNFHCDSWQVRAYENLLEFHHVAVRSGSGVGKTAWLSSAVVWFMMTHPLAKIPCTAPSQHQLFDLLWSECSRWINRSEFLRNRLIWTQSRIAMKGFEAMWFAVARTATVSPDGQVAEGLQGFHGDTLLFVIDETSGVPDAIFPAYEGALTGEDCYSILTGNPTRRSGYFFDVFHLPKTGNKFCKMHVSCEDTLRVSRQYIEAMEERYGREHPIFRIKVLGEFAEASDDTLIPPDYIFQMQQNKKDEIISPKMPIEIGFDFGRSGNHSYACVRQGFNVLQFYKHKRLKGKVNDGIDTAIWADRIIKQWNADVIRPDGNGLGATICDLLINGFESKGVKVKGHKNVRVFIAQSRATNNGVYGNLRSEACWIFREKVSKLWCASWPKDIVKILENIRKSPDDDKKKEYVEGKKEMMDRIKQNSDQFDALVQAFASNADEDIPAESALFTNKSLEINTAFKVDSRWRIPEKKKSRFGWMRAC